MGRVPEKKGLDVINRANAEAYIGFLASDALEGVKAGFRGGRIAGEYIVSNLKRWDRTSVRILLPTF